MNVSRRSFLGGCFVGALAALFGTPAAPAPAAAAAPTFASAADWGAWQEQAYYHMARAYDLTWQVRPELVKEGS